MAGAAFPDLLLVDLHLPGMSGLDLCERIEAMPVRDRCVTVCTSAHAAEDELRRLRALPFVRFVPKGDALMRRLPAYVRAAQQRASRHHQRLSGRHARIAPVAP